MQLILFDVDGTLVDSQHGIVEAQAMAFAAHGLPAPLRERALSVVGLSLMEAFTALAGPQAPVADLAEAYKAAWLELRARPGFAEPLYPGAAETLHMLGDRDDVRLGIATGKSRRGVARLVADHGWGRLFATIQTADDHPSKPDPSMVRAALAETGIAAREATMIGDTCYDMAMARGAGVRAIGVAWGYHDRAALLTSGAQAIAESFSALRDLLDEQAGRRCAPAGSAGQSE